MNPPTGDPSNTSTGNVMPGRRASDPQTGAVPPHSPDDRRSIEPLPRPVVKKMRWPFPIIWIVPLGAAALAGYFLYQHHHARAIPITIDFPDGSGIEPGQTVVKMHGVDVGRVQSMTLSADHAHAQAHVTLDADNEFLTRQGSAFWLVRPQISLENISGLSTIVSGPYIEVRPGDGEKTTAFTGLLDAPKPLPPGRKIVLHSDNIGAITIDSPVTYLGIQVGQVQDIRLAVEADSANITIIVWERFAPLVRSNSVFWQVRGADLKGSLLSGVSLSVGSLRSLISGGVTFATPQDLVAPQAGPEADFVLNDKPVDAWLTWHPRIKLPVAPTITTEPAAPGIGGAALPTPKRE